MLLGIDVGGTFTDAVVLRQGEVVAQAKRATTHDDVLQCVLAALDKKALITAGLHLGEGTGAVASLPLWDMALAVYNGCYSFAEGGITPYTPQC